MESFNGKLADPVPHDSPTQRVWISPLASEAVGDTEASPVTLRPPQYRIEQPLGLTWWVVQTLEAEQVAATLCYFLSTAIAAALRTPKRMRG